jgi:hypothetical protein
LPLTLEAELGSDRDLVIDVADVAGGDMRAGESRVGRQAWRRQEKSG